MKCKKTKRLSEESLKIAEKKREAKGKEEKESYTNLNAVFQRRAKSGFLSDQWKEMEENISMGKTKDLFKKIRDTKGIFHTKVGSIKDRNCMEHKILRRGGKNTEKNCSRRIFMTQIITMV